MKKVRAYVVVYLLLLVNSCSINGSFQGLYGYQDSVAKKNPELIKRPTVDICDITNPKTPTIYSVTGNDVRNCINNMERSLLYIWRPKCSSKICIPLESIQNICNIHGIELFIVAEYYDYGTMNIRYSIDRPAFGIDCQYYKSNLTKTYLSKFLYEVLGSNETLSNDYFFLFNYENLMAKGESIEQVGL